MSVVEKFILNNWKEHLDKSSVTEIDAKTQLQEYSLKKYKTLPVYTIKKQSGPHHNPISMLKFRLRILKSFLQKERQRKMHNRMQPKNYY